MSLRNPDGVEPSLRDAITVRDKALAGDLVFIVFPATTTQSARSTAWSRTVRVELQTAAGEVHDWFDRVITSGCSVGDTSAAGVASINNTTLTFVAGQATKVVNGNAANWLNGDTDTLTIAQATVMGYTVTQKTSVQTFTA